MAKSSTDTIRISKAPVEIQTLQIPDLIRIGKTDLFVVMTYL